MRRPIMDASKSKGSLMRDAEPKVRNDIKLIVTFTGRIGV